MKYALHYLLHRLLSVYHSQLRCSFIRAVDSLLIVPFFPVLGSLYVRVSFVIRFCFSLFYFYHHAFQFVLFVF